MRESPKQDGLMLREATEHDIAQLSAHHRMMFEEIWAKKGQPISDSVALQVEHSYARKLREELPGGTCRAWIIESRNQAVASGAITIVSMVPTPTDLSPNVAYVHSIYTEFGQRGKKLASRIVKAALAYCRENGIKRVFLNASEAGRPVYEKIGFASCPNTMRISLE